MYADQAIDIQRILEGLTLSVLCVNHNRPDQLMAGGVLPVILEQHLIIRQRRACPAQPIMFQWRGQLMEHWSPLGAVKPGPARDVVPTPVLMWRATDVKDAQCY